MDWAYPIRPTIVTNGSKPLSQIKVRIKKKQIRPLQLKMQEEIVLSDNFRRKINFLRGKFAVGIPTNIEAKLHEAHSHCIAKINKK